MGIAEIPRVLDAPGGLLIYKHEVYVSMKEDILDIERFIVSFQWVTKTPAVFLERR
jgi:hypothetical protein